MKNCTERNIDKDRLHALTLWYRWQCCCCYSTDLLVKNKSFFLLWNIFNFYKCASSAKVLCHWLLFSETVGLVAKHVSVCLVSDDSLLMEVLQERVLCSKKCQ